MKTDKINMVINLSILALLIYLAVAVKSVQKEVFWDKSIMKPAIGEYHGFAKASGDDIHPRTFEQCFKRCNQPTGE